MPRIASYGVYYWFGSQLTSWDTNDNKYSTATDLHGPWSEWKLFAPEGAKTYDSQVDIVVPLDDDPYNSEHFLFIGDRWQEHDLGNSPIVQMPISIADGVASLTWSDTYEGTIAQTSVPGHTLDNSLRYDSMLFDFGAGKSFQLKSVTVGWWQTDSDLTILAYTGTGTPTFTSSSASQGYSSLLGSGWSVVKSSTGTTGTAHYANAANGGVAQSSNAAGYKPLPVNDLNISARYWLVGALNTLVQALPSGASVGAGNDYVKIAGVGGDFKGVPEPGGFMLLGVALAGLVVHRRRA